MKKNENVQKSARVPTAKMVRLEFCHHTAKAISVAGTFNAWSPAATPMASAGEGRWFKEMPLEPGVYEYRLVADGEWLPDSQAADTVPNPFGGLNSVLVVSAGGG